MAQAAEQQPASEANAEKRAYLFLCPESGHYAISTDPAGENLPGEICISGWRFVKSLSVEVQHPLPLNIDPEPVIRALADRGYYLLAADGLPHGTSQ